jgi:pilus assembly protein CpaB
MRQSIYVLLAAVIGIFLTIGIVKWLDIGNPGSRGHKIVVAQAEIAPGSIISAMQVEITSWPGEVPQASFSDKKLVVNRVAREKIYAGEPVIDGKLAPVGSKAGMESMISIGKRAITVRVNDIVGVAGFALPGSYVDVLANIHDASNQSYSKVVLNRVKVLAVAQDTTTDPSKPKVVNAVTLELTPTEAEKLDLVRTIGTLSLVLRNELDNTNNTSPGARVNDLMKNSETVEEVIVTKNTPARINELDDGKNETKVKVTRRYIDAPREGNGRVEEIRGLNRSKTQDAPN